ncbi:MAG: RecX family transcriptional regulator [Flavobacteriaceae bacterium]|nr:RecX family transcriptional regulator [Flavobacteriaceae bacterium]
MQKTKSYTVDQAQFLLERYCIYQDRCHIEVEKKLKTLNIITEAQEIIIIHLIQNDFLNEERFAKSFVRGKFNIKKWGKYKIKNELKFRQISAYNIKTAMNEIDDEVYTETIKKLVVKKAATLSEENIFIKKKKILNFLLQKGYEFKDVITLVNQNL